MITIKDKKAALEMSVGTIVTIVLMVSMLVLGLVLIRSIFAAGSGAIKQIDDKTRSAINTIFQEDSKKTIIPVPTDRKVTIKQGASQEGFGFILRNTYTAQQDFVYTVGVDPTFAIESKCNGLTKAGADGWLVGGTEGSIPLGPGRIQEYGELILFNVPRDAPPCTIPFVVNVYKGTAPTQSNFYSSLKMVMTIEGE